MSVTCRVIIAAGLSMAIASQSFADEPTSSGTGFAVTADGWIVTNAHVVQECGRIEVKGRGDAAYPRIDEINDLAVVKITTGEPLKPLAFGSTASVVCRSRRCCKHSLQWQERRHRGSSGRHFHLRVHGSFAPP